MHEDDDLLVIDKPSGLLSVTPPDQDRENVFSLVKEHVRAGRGKRRAWIVHRLDKEASGLLVFAKTEKAFQWLKEDLRQKRVHRLYVAVVEGELGRAAGGAAGVSGAISGVKQLPSGTVQSFIQDEDEGLPRSIGLGDVARARARAPQRPTRGKAAGSQEHEDHGPKLAVTHWRVLAYGHGRTLVQLRLETGRKNQIRLHMAELGHPVVGDDRFGAKSDPIGRVALHASELGFNHPASGQSVRYVSPTPGPFRMLVGAEAGAVASASAAEPAEAERTPAPSTTPVTPAAETSWENVAGWYDELIEEEKSDHFREVIVPGTMRLLEPRRGMRVLDVACGQGALVRDLVALGTQAKGIDASPRLIAAAQQRSGMSGAFAVGDARELIEPARTLGIEPGSLDAATCVMALMNIEPLAPAMRGVAALLKPGGVFVGVMLHPAFRAPGQTSWGWDERRSDDAGARPGRGQGPVPMAMTQYRRVDGYLSPGQHPIVMNPGGVARGASPVTTWTFHRPIQSYVRALGDAGLLIRVLEEWPSSRRSQPGKTPQGKARAAEENRARREIPMFLAFAAVKVRMD